MSEIIIEKIKDELSKLLRTTMFQGLDLSQLYIYKYIEARKDCLPNTHILDELINLESCFQEFVRVTKENYG